MCYIVEATVMVQFCYFKSLYLEIETVSLLFPSDVTDGKDGHGLKLRKLGQLFQSFPAMPQKVTKKIFVVRPWQTLFDIFLLTLKEHFVYGYGGVALRSR